MHQDIRQASLIRYAGLALPLAFAGLPIYMLAPDYYSVHLQLSLSTLGFGLLALRIADAFLDPLLGRLIDRFIDSARTVSFVASVLLFFGFFMLFCPPTITPYNLVGWFFISVFLVTLGFSALTILYGAVGAMWSEDTSNQTRITSYREALTLCGLVLSISVPFLLMEVLPVRLAYSALVGLFSLLLVLSYVRYLPLQSQVVDARSRGQKKVSERPMDVEPKASMAFLYVSYAISALASAVPAVLVVFFVREYLGSQTFIGTALVIYFLSGAVSMPLWQSAARRVGKVRAWQVSMILAVFSFTWVCLLSPGDYLIYSIVCLMSGVALGAEMALPPAILAEYVDGENTRSAAQKYSGLTMISKLSLAVAAGVCLPLLSFFGFQAGDSNDAESLTVLVLLYGALPGVLKLLALGSTQVWIQKEKAIQSNANI